MGAARPRAGWGVSVVPDQKEESVALVLHRSGLDGAPARLLPEKTAGDRPDSGHRSNTVRLGNGGYRSGLIEIGRRQLTADGPCAGECRPELNAGFVAILVIEESDGIKAGLGKLGRVAAGGETKTVIAVVGDHLLALDRECAAIVR